MNDLKPILPSGGEGDAGEQLPALQRDRVTREVLESYIFIESRRNVGVYGERLFDCLVESAQAHILGIDIVETSRVEVGEWGEARIAVPIQKILCGDEDTNYAQARDAIRAIMGSYLEYDNGGTEYHATQIFNEVDMSTLKGRVVIEVNRNIWQALLDYSKGYSRVDLEVKRRLKSIYSVRLYPYISNKKTPITLSLAELRRQWQLGDKYPSAKDFIRNTVAVAKRELDKVSPWSFDYVVNASHSAPENTGRTGRPKATSVTLIPVHRMTGEKDESLLRRHIAPSMVLSQEERTVLKERFGFDNEGLQNNLPLLEAVRKNSDLLGFLRKIGPAADRANNPCGYVVNALKKHLDDLGVELRDPAKGRGGAAHTV